MRMTMLRPAKPVLTLSSALTRQRLTHRQLTLSRVRAAYGAGGGFYEPATGYHYQVVRVPSTA